VHASTFGNPNDARIPRYEVDRTVPHVLRRSKVVRSEIHGITRDFALLSELTLPFASFLVDTDEDGTVRYAGHDVASPNSAYECTLYQIVVSQTDDPRAQAEYMRLARSGRGAVQRELHRLESAGLVSVQMHGNQKHYQANRDSPLFKEICGIVRKTVGLEAPLRAAVESLPGPVDLALIYGSVAKRADTSASDIDLLIVADHLTLEDVFAALSPAEQLLDRKINPTLYTNEEFSRHRTRGNPFLKRVLEGPVIILAGSIDDE